MTAARSGSSDGLCSEWTGGGVTGAGQGAHTHTFRACPAPPHTRTARPLHAGTEKRVSYRPSWPTASVRSHWHGGLAAAAAQLPRKANPLWPCGTPGRDGAEAAELLRPPARCAHDFARAPPARTDGAGVVSRCLRVGDVPCECVVGRGRRGVCVCARC